MKYRFYYRDKVEQARFYNALGYNLGKPKFHQALIKFKKTRFYKTKRIVYDFANFKYLVRLKKIINRKFFIEDKSKFFTFLYHLEKIYMKIKMYNKEEVKEAFKEQIKLFYKELTLPKIKLLIEDFTNQLYRRLRYFFRKAN